MVKRQSFKTIGVLEEGGKKEKVQEFRSALGTQR